MIRERSSMLRYTYTVCLVTRVQVRFDSHQRQHIYLCSEASKPVVEPIQDSTQRVAKLLPRGGKAAGTSSCTHIHIVPRLNNWRYTLTPPYAFMACTDTVLRSPKSHNRCANKSTNQNATEGKTTHPTASPTHLINPQ